MRIRRKWDSGDFEHVAVDARQADWSILETVDLHGFFYIQPSLGVKENGPRNRKHPVSGSGVDENILLMSDIRRE